MNLYHIKEKQLIDEYIEKYGLYIVDDNWDDFGYKTRFNLYVADKNKKVQKIGPMKITYKDYRADSEMAIHYYRKPADRLKYGSSVLFDEFCSLGESLEYYKRLWQVFENKDEYNRVLLILRDVTTHREVYDAFVTDRSFNQSLLRESSSLKAFRDVQQMYASQDDKERKRDLNFTFSFVAPYASESSKPVEIQFDFSMNVLPNRIHAIIGKNGTGKTLLLNALAESLSGLASIDRNFGFIGDRPTVDRVISMAYSAFDDGFKSRESSRYDSNVSYIYCGIHSNKGLLSLKELNLYFEKARKEIIRKKRQDKWKEIMNELIEEEFKYIIQEVIENGIYGVNMSSGQRILLSTMTEAISNIEEGSILLIDELELHLHPNAIANTVRMIYKLLELFDSYAIVATHSPLVIQEIPKKYVHVLYRDGNTLFTSNPKAETFGKDITSIIDDIFDVLNIESNYQTVLKELSQKYKYEEIMSFFEGKLPLNARLFLSNCYPDSV